MTQHDPHNNDNIPIDTGFPDYFHIVPIERGADKKKWKAPQAKGWNDDRTASAYPNHLYDGYNGGICHKQSGTCAIDIDDLIKARELFTARGIDLNRLLMSGCQISSGRENRSKLLYKLPDEVIMLQAYPRLRQIAEPSGMVLEFRCVYGTGKTCQDVAPGSIHPDNGEHYKWNGYEQGIPVIPQELLQWWYELMPKVKADDSQWVGSEDTPELRSQVTRALKALSPDLSYPEWRDVGVAIHDTGWPDAFDIWDEWSAQGMEYDFDYTLDKWDDMTHGRGIKITKLFALAYQQDKNWDRKTADEMFAQIAQEAPVTIDAGSGQVEVDVMKLCEDLHFNPPQDALNLALSHVAAEPDIMMRETYVRVISDQTQVGRPAVRQRINDLIGTSGVPAGTIDWVQVNDSGQPLQTIENFYLMMEHEQYAIRYNTMVRSIEVDRPSRGREVIQDAKALALLTELKSLSIQNGMRTEMVREYRDYMAYCNSYHPFHQFLTEQEMLGGTYTFKEPDYLQALCDSLIVGEDSLELRDKLIKTWMVSVVAAAFMTWDLDKKPVRGVLVLQGPQQMGKSYWFEKLLPVGMVKSGASINKNDMNHLKTATNRLIVELAEAEFNSRNLDMVAYLKSIVGRSVDELRKAYDSEEVQLLRRSVFCITTNPSTFLVDDENSRYFTVPCLGIDRGKYNSIPMGRLWMQVKAMYDAGLPYLLDEVTNTQLQVLNEEHRAKSRFEDWLLDTFHFDTMEGVDDSANWYTRTQIDTMAGDAMDVNAGSAVDIIKRLTQQLKATATCVHGDRGRFWRFPTRRVYSPTV